MVSFWSSPTCSDNKDLPVRLRSPYVQQTMTFHHKSPNEADTGTHLGATLSSPDRDETTCRPGHQTWMTPTRLFHRADHPRYWLAETDVWWSSRSPAHSLPVSERPIEMEAVVLQRSPRQVGPVPWWRPVQAGPTGVPWQPVLRTPGRRPPEGPQPPARQVGGTWHQLQARLSA